MKNKFIIFVVGLFISNVGFAGEVMSAGEVLEQDSYVFKIDEAKKLMERLQELEKNERLLQYYIDLDKINQEKAKVYEDTIDLKEQEITLYQELSQTHENRVKQLEKQNANKKLENYAFFGAGVLLAVGSILVADKVDDLIEKY